MENCVVATVPGRGWDLRDDDFEDVRWTASLLFLAAWAKNSYFPHFGGPYTNASAFRVIWQRFTGTPVYIALVSRRRDGRTMDGGYRHGEVTFPMPLQCSVREPAAVDESFLAALDAAHAAGSETIQRLKFALPFVSLANTDDDSMEEAAEAILMGSAFEQLLKGDASAYKLARKFGVLFEACGTVTVEDARKVRPGIQIDGSTAERAAAQPKWFVHRKWMEELYDVRSKVVHRGTPAGPSWGWTLSEHLVMAAWTFPLAVKLLLAREGHYALTHEDRARCLSVDKLLGAVDWSRPTEEGTGPPVWAKIVAQTRLDYDMEQSLRRFIEEHPEFRLGDGADAGT